MTTITHYKTHDLRYPTSLSGDGTDATNRDCDYSSAYIVLYTDGADEGHGMTFTIGKGNDICIKAISTIADSLIGKKTQDLFDDMGAMWSHVTEHSSQLRWLGPDKGVIALAAGAVVNAVWDMYARHEKKPLWRLVYDFTPEQFVKAAAFRYCTDAITKEEAIELLKSKRSGREERLSKMMQQGYPSYTTSVGWLGYSDEKVQRLTREAIAAGFSHFKLKVGLDVEQDLQRMALVRAIIDDPKECANRPTPAPETLVGKNAGPTGSVLMVDANQYWDVPEAIEYVKKLSVHKPWFIEEPTAPDDILGHAKIRQGLKSCGVGVATGEHAHNRMTFKQLLQAEAIDVCQIDSCRVAGVNEILTIMLMAAKYGVPVCPHAGGVGLCEHVIHLSLIDYLCVSGSCDRNVLEYVDHLHEEFVYPTRIHQDSGRYRVPMNESEGYSIEFTKESIDTYTFPTGKYWSDPENRKLHNMEAVPSTKSNGVH